MSINKSQWLEKCKYWKNLWKQGDLPEHDNDEFGINLYKFISILNKNLKDDSVIVSDAGSAAYTLGQSLELKNNQRWILDGGEMAMGMALPSSIGVSLARNKGQTIVVTGDGSFQTNIQELATISYHKLPIVLFVWSNDGYLSIRNTQTTFYNGRIFGTDKEHGLFFPDLKKIAEAYELGYIKIDTIKELEDNIDYIMNLDKAIIVEVKCDPNQKIIPTAAMKDGVSQPLHQMWPFLDDETLDKEMIKD